jgi:hypothetical protein
MIQSLLAVLRGHLTIEALDEAKERWFYYKTECERLAKAAAYHEERANVAARMLNEAERGRKAASDALGQKVIDEMKAKP